MGSATMDLLKGSKGKSAAKAAETDTDAELKDDAPAPAEAEAEEEEQAEEAPAADEDAGPIAGDPEAENDAAEEAEPAPAGVAIPTSKTEVHALKLAELPAVHEAMGSPIANFDKLDLKGKKQALLDHLFPKGGQAKSQIAGSDTLTKIAAEIEQLKTRSEVEQRLADISQIEGENFFRKGGLLVKLSEIGDFGEHANFQEYVKAEGIAPDYRTARYWMSIYTGLIELGIPYSEVEGIGWTKTVIILPVITKENIADWVAKAKAMNVATLKATVEAELNKDNTSGGGASGSSPIKSMVFKFHQDQYDTANDAIAKAKKAAGTEVKEVAADLIFTEFLANAPNKAKKAAKDEAPAAAGPAKLEFNPDELTPEHVEAFFAAIHTRFPDRKEAMGFLFSGPEDQELAEGEDEKSYFELNWPEVELDLNIPD